MDIGKINPFSSIAQTKSVNAIDSKNPFAAEKTSFGSNKKENNSFAASTYGINANIGVGDTMSIPAQAGKQPGIGKTYAFA